MLDDQDGRAAVNEALQHVEEDLHVVRMQANRRLVEDKQRPVLAASHLRGQLKSLRLTAGQGGRGLPQRQVAQAEAGQRLEESTRFLESAHGHPGLVHAHRHDLGQAQALASDLIGLGPVAAPPALRALDVHVRQELNVQGDLPGTVAGRAAQRARVVGERARLQPGGCCLLGASEGAAQLVQHPGICGDGRAHVNADGRRVDQVDAGHPGGIHVAHVPGQRLTRQLGAQRGNQRFQHERRLAGPAHARHRRQRPHGDVYAQRCHRVYPQGLQVNRAAPIRVRARFRLPRLPFNPARARHVRANAGGGGGAGLVDGPLEDDAATVRASARADLDEGVGSPEDARVVVDDDGAVSVGDQLADNREDPVDVGGVQADRRFVEDVEDPGRAIAHRAGQLDALAFAVGQGRGGAVQRQVGQAQLDEAFHRLSHLVDDNAGHGRDLIRDKTRDPRGPLAQFGQGQAGGRSQVHTVDEGGAHPLPQPRALAGGTRAGDEVLGDAGEGLLVLGLRQRVFDGGNRVEVCEVQVRASRLGGHDDVPFLGRALVDDRLFSVGQVSERHVGTHAHLPRDVLHEFPHEGSPRGDGPFVNGERLIGHEGVTIHEALDARPLAHGTRAPRVEGHLLGSEPIEGLRACRAHERNLEGDGSRGRHTVPVGAQVGARTREQEPQVVEEFRGRAKG